MKKSYKDQLDPVVNLAVERLDKIEKNIKDRERELEKQLKEQHELEKSIKIKERERVVAHKKQIDKLGDDMGNYKNLSEQLVSEIAEYNKLNKESDLQNRKMDDLVNEIAGEKDLIAKERSKQEGKSKQYQNKIDMLGADEAKLNEVKNTLVDRERAIRTKEKINLDTEEKLMNWQAQLQERELDIKISEKAVKFKEKRVRANLK